MCRIRVCVVRFLIILVLLPLLSAEQEDVKRSLMQFMDKLMVGSPKPDGNWGWNSSSDPCIDKWMGVTCYPRSPTVRKIVLEGLNFTGTFNAASLCVARSLAVLSLKGNGIVGTLPAELGNCRSLTHLYISENRFTGNLPDSLLQLSNLKRIDISNNFFSGEVPGDIPRISGLLSFLAQNNQLSGPIPNFDFSNLLQFDVSNNNFSGSIPDEGGKFSASSFSGNPGLCGSPLPNACPPAPPPLAPPSNSKPKHSSKRWILIYAGYVVLALLLLIAFALVLVSKYKQRKRKVDDEEKTTSLDPRSKISSTATSSREKTSENRSEYSIGSIESGMTSTSLIVLRSLGSKRLTLEELLRAPAELLGRGKHGSLYKVVLNDGATLVVKRIRDWNIPGEDFKIRMQRIYQATQPRVLAPVALYYSKQEKLLVYEFQPNGSLHKLLHGSQNGEAFDWGSRLTTAATVAESLTLMHKELQEDGIGHGNLKSVNILFNKDMEPCVSEYGLKVVENQDQSFLSQTASFQNRILTETKAYTTFMLDVYCFGVILLELLTGKVVQNNGLDLAKWIHSVVKEEWTTEVFDKALMSEGASEERMVNLLQVALKCINPSPIERPSMNEVAVMINEIKEEEERSMISES